MPMVPAAQPMQMAVAPPAQPITQPVAQG